MQHLSSEQIKDYGRRALPPVDMLAADDHLCECVECHRRVAPIAISGSAFRSVQEAFLHLPDGPTAHLEYAQLVALLDDTLEDAEREIIAGHLEGCASCKNELRELSAFRAELTAEDLSPQIPVVVDVPTRPAPERPEIAAPASVEQIAQVGYGTKPKSWWRRLKNKLTSAKDWTWLEAAILSLLVLALIFGLFWYSGRKERERYYGLGSGGPSYSAPLAPPPVVSVPVGNAPGAAGPGASPQAGGSALPYNGAPGSVYNPPPLPPQPGVNGPQPLPPATTTIEFAAKLNDGGSGVALDKQGQLYGPQGLSPDLQQAVKNALSRQAVEVGTPPFDAGARVPVLTKGNTEHVPFGLIGPLNTVLQTGRPIFRWQKMAGAETYVVTVFDQNFHAVAVSGKINGTSWQPGNALQPGNIYMWQVAATKDGQEVISPTAPAPEARFKVLEAEHIKNIEQASQSRSRLALGLAYARAGLLREAREEFNALQRANPDSPIAGKLLQAIQKAGG